MDTLCKGHPVFELGSMFHAFVGYAELNHQNMMDFFGYSFETAGEFWKKALEMYLGTEDPAACEAIAEKAVQPAPPITPKKAARSILNPVAITYCISPPAIPTFTIFFIKVGCIRSVITSSTIKSGAKIAYIRPPFKNFIKRSIFISLPFRKI